MIVILLLMKITSSQVDFTFLVRLNFLIEKLNYVLKRIHYEKIKKNIFTYSYLY